MGSTTVDKQASQQKASGWWLYLLACTDGRTDTGIAVDVEARFRTHQAGKGARFTRANRPVAILGAQSFPDRSTALKAEYALKQQDKAAKLAWSREHQFR
jgi:putative endonuclease